MSVATQLCLTLLLLGLAFWIVVVRDTFSAVAGFIPYGLLLTSAWLSLSAIDVALTEAAIGAGLTGALLVAAASRLRKTEALARRERPGKAICVIAAISAATVSVAILACVLLLPAPAPTLAPEVAQHLASTGVGNPITAVLMSFRAMDTLLEAIVLFIGLIAVWSLAPDRAWGGRPGAAPAVDPDGTLAYLARVLPPIGIVIGIYVFWVGADHPGGKFQGATILAALWLLVIMSGLRDAPSIQRKWLRLVIVVGPAVFIAVGLLGAVSSGAFLSYPEGFAKPLIVLIEIALLPSLAVTLALLLLGPPERAEPSP
jgi:multisubunit Na+/H+ antiporter MnhB subunit